MVNATHTAFGVTPPPIATPAQEPDIVYTAHDQNLLNTYYFHPDHLGSSSYITNSAGMVSQHMEYMPFGETLVDEHLNSNNSPFKFNGKEFDEETGNYYYSARYYDPKLSIFISVDPLAERTFSSYGYCYNNPIRFIDYDGQSPKDIIHVDKDGFVTSVGKNGSAEITIVTADGQRYTPSTLDTKNHLHIQIMANIGGYYRTEMGLNKKFRIGATGNPDGESSKKNPAFTLGSDKRSYFNTTGGFSEALNNANNLKSIILHEVLHQENMNDNVKETLSTHVDLYINQMTHSSFKDTSEKFKIQMALSTANYMLNMDKSDQFSAGNVVDKIESFNAIPNFNFKLTYQNPPGSLYPKGQLNLTLHYNNKQYPVIYTQEKN